VLGSLLTTQFTSSLRPALAALPASAEAAAGTGLAGALEVARELPGGPGGALAEAARAAFVVGFGLAGLVAAGLALAAAVGAYILLPRHADGPGTEPDAGGELGGQDVEPVASPVLAVAAVTPTSDGR
jgi:hypothetical protein